MATIQEMREEHKRIEEIINHRIKTESFKISDLVEDYKLGRSDEFLRTRYRLLDKELNYIINCYVTANDRNRREENIEKFNSVETNIRVQKEQEDEKDEVPKTRRERMNAVLEAIKNVEGEER